MSMATPLSATVRDVQELTNVVISVLPGLLRKLQVVSDKLQEENCLAEKTTTATQTDAVEMSPGSDYDNGELPTPLFNRDTDEIQQQIDFIQHHFDQSPTASQRVVKESRRHQNLSFEHTKTIKPIMFHEPDGPCSSAIKVERETDNYTVDSFPAVEVVDVDSSVQSTSTQQRVNARTTRNDVDSSTESVSCFINDSNFLSIQDQLSNMINCQQQPFVDEPSTSDQAMEVAHHDHQYSSDEHLVGQFECDRCPARFGTYLHLCRHKKKQHSNEMSAAMISTCELCGKEFKLFTSLERHIHIRHSANQSGYGRKRCEKCGKLFQDGWHLKRHLPRCKIGRWMLMEAVTDGSNSEMGVQ